VRPATALVGLLGTSALVTSACGAPGDGTVTVLAASSLSVVLPDVEALLEAQDPTTDIEIAYAGSSTILQQVDAGAGVDAVVLASEDLVDRLDPALVTGDPVLVAANSLAVVTPVDNPAGVGALDDLARDDLTLVLCAPQVPCGASAAVMLERAGISPAVASYEPDVVSTLRRVSGGEADVGVVYVTDALDNPDVATVAVPPELNVTTRYPAVALGDSAVGEDLVAALVSAEVQGLFAAAGFAAP
jgi:molybdate transport system substrate-binding protein